MITEDYVSFEIAKLLKEKGFDEPCRTYYQDEKFVNDVCTQYYQWNSKSPFEQISAPSIQMATKWLREVHHYYIQVEFDPPTFSADIYKMDEIDEYGSAKHIQPTFANIKSYEEAVEAALKYSLEDLI